MTTQHTPRRLKVQHPHAGKRGWEIAYEPGLEQVCQNITEANARRLVACWNRCERFSTEDLENPAVDLTGHGALLSENIWLKCCNDELLEALRIACDTPELQDGTWEKLARAAIQKAEGKS